VKNNILKLPVLAAAVLVIICTSYVEISQAAPFSDSVRFNRNKIYSLALDGEIRKALTFLMVSDSTSIPEKEWEFKIKFESRFHYLEDKSGYAEEHRSPIDSLLKIYSDYWRQAFLFPEYDNDSLLMNTLAAFLGGNFGEKYSEIRDDDNLNIYLKKYVNSKGLQTTGFGRTGKYLDLLVWRTMYDTLYKFNLFSDTINVKVVFMDGFVTLGWEEYATFGTYYPGGWADSSALYCVKPAYDLSSENFLVSYLAHEGRHYSDYEYFPKLSGADLEYRAKLTELSLAETSLFKLLKFFIENANFESDNSHSVANYCVVRDLSRAIFSNDFENDIEKWKGIDTRRINEASYSILSKNTEELRKLGINVQDYIKNK